MLNLSNAVIYDCETFPNCFTLAMECLHSDQRAIWEISHYRDDRACLMEWFGWLAQTQTPMIGFNNLGFDYPIIHDLFHYPDMSVEQIYQKAMNIIQSDDRFGHTIWANKRFCPQIDLYKINHFDNPAKSTSLKWLQVNMRSPSVQDIPIANGTFLTEQQIRESLIPYNIHDVSKTKEFAHTNQIAIDFRNNLVGQFGVEVLNWNDTKIGEEMMIQRLPDELCYDRSSGRKVRRQTYRDKIEVKDIIFPHVRFDSPELNQLLEQFKNKTIYDATKDVFGDLTANVGGLTFHYGTGGVHGSVSKQKFKSCDKYVIQDIDVASLYPSIAIVNHVRPAHLGHLFTQVYAELPKERKRWQQEKGKKCVEANALKLASNGVYGKSNSEWSVFYDPQFTMTITINGQLLLTMLAEQLVKVPTLQLIQINTDGLTHIVDRQYVEHCKSIWKWWEDLTQLVLEDVEYTHMFVRDVNSYIAVGVDGSIKLKGAYWTPDADNYHKSMAESQPPAWHKNLSNTVSVRAAVNYFTTGQAPNAYIRSCTNPYEFLCATKAKGKAQFYIDGQPTQSTCRYYVSHAGGELVKVQPPLGPLGAPCRGQGVTKREYEKVMNEVGWVWDERVCTKNGSTYQERRSQVESKGKVKICNNIEDFNFGDVNYDWYIYEAHKLIF